jgi:hypothetical protein
MTSWRRYPPLPMGLSSQELKDTGLLNEWWKSSAARVCFLRHAYLLVAVPGRVRGRPHSRAPVHDVAVVDCRPLLAEDTNVSSNEHEVRPFSTTPDHGTGSVMTAIAPIDSRGSAATMSPSSSAP